VLGPLGPLDQLGPTGSSVEFQDIPHHHDSAALLHPDAASSSSSASVDDSSHSPPLPSHPPSNASFYQLAYYQHYFDVTTSQIRSRLFRALLPMTGGKFYHDEDSKPDFYGPFWITTTLIFLLAAAGNFANYISFIANNAQTNYQPSTVVNGTEPEPSAQHTLDHLLVWTYDFEKVSVGASVFYAWITLVPAIVYCAFARIGPGDGAPQKGLVEIASLFGYGLATFLPVCILCIPPISLLRWLSISVAFLWSSYFLIKNLGADVNNKAVFPIIAGIVLLNLGIAILTKFYFFEF
jgi:hypothetical protein